MPKVKVSDLSVDQMMWFVILTMVPALAFLTFWQGMGFIIHCVIAIIAGVIFDWGSKLSPTVLTALLFAAGLPAFAAWWVPIVGMFFAMVIAKRCFGGLGHNVFNPAMVGYAVVLIAFPTEMVIWPSWSVDTLSAATPLDHANEAFPLSDRYPYFILSALWLLGGLVLLFKRIITWHIPLSLLLGVLIASIFFNNPVDQLFLGATQIGAFYIATDPVTAPAQWKMRLIYGFSLGILLVILRETSSYPDGLAFAILIANCFTPLMDKLSIRTSS